MCSSSDPPCAAQRFLHRLEADHGITVEVHAGKLHVQPTSALTDADKATLTKYRSAIVRYLYRMEHCVICGSPGERFDPGGRPYCAACETDYLTPTTGTVIYLKEHRA